MKSSDFLQVLNFRAKQDGISGKDKASNAQKIDGIPQSMIVGKAAVYFPAHSRSGTCRSFLCRNFAKKMSTCSKEATANMEMIHKKWRLSHDNLHLNKRELTQFNQKCQYLYGSGNSNVLTTALPSMLMKNHRSALYFMP